MRQVWRAMGLVIPLLAASAGAAHAATPVIPVPPVPRLVEELLFDAGFESGDLSGFIVYDTDRVGSPPPEFVTDPGLARDGTVALAFTIPAGGMRNEIIPRLDLFRPGDELYFAFSTRLQPGFPVEPGFQIVAQWKNEGEGSPPLELSIAEGGYRLSGGFGHPDGPMTFREPLGPAVPGRWDDWTVRILFSPDPAVGSVDVWRNGIPVLAGYAPPSGTLYPGDASYLKIGYYREPKIRTDGTVVFDSIRVGTTAEDVRVARTAAAAHPEGEAGD